VNALGLVDALELPAGARVDQRVPKRLLAENGAPTAADKRQIAEGIEELRWVAALKPTTVGVPVYRDLAREYLEIAVLSLTLRANARAGRLTELVHRAVPYPVWLVTALGPKLTLTLAHKRWSQGEAGKTVLDGEIVEAVLDSELDAGLLRTFQGALSLARQPRNTLYALYQGWIDAALALQAARITGAFVLPDSAERRAGLREGLDVYDRLLRDIALLRGQAEREKQLNRLVELNLEMRRLEAELTVIKETLAWDDAQ
jgi:hypothetical protein